MYGLPDSWAAWGVGRAFKGTTRLAGGRALGGRSFRPSVPVPTQVITKTDYNMDIRFKWGGLVIYKSVLNFETTHVQGMVGVWMRGRGQKIQMMAREMAGSKTGALKRSIKLDVRSRTYGIYMTIGSSLHYAYDHHEGTKPKKIEPKEPGGVLSFKKGAKVVVTREVMHPGTPPNKYLTTPMRRVIRSDRTNSRLV